METFVRWSGYGLVVSGLLTLPVLWHPDIFDVGFVAASTQVLWAPGHAAGLLVAALTLLAVAGWGALLGRRAGRLGAIGAVLTVFGLVATAGLAAVEAFVFPVLAREHPALLELDGPLLGSLIVRAVGGVALLWLVGLTCIGVATERSGALPRGPGWLLAAGAAAFAMFEGPFVPVLGQLSVLLFAAGQAWFGVTVARGSGVLRVVTSSTPGRNRSPSAAPRSAGG